MVFNCIYRLFKKIAVCFLLNVLTIFVFAEQQINANFFDDYIFKAWTGKDGLPGNTVTDIIQDSDGFLLIGTYEGLVRFDGVKFITLNRNKDSNFNFLSARAVFQDSKKNLWVGANDEGVTVMTNKSQIITFDTASGLPNNSIRAFCEDKDGNIWIGTAGGIACINSNFELFIPKALESLPKGNSYIISKLYCDKVGRVWFVCGDEGGTYFYENSEVHAYSQGKNFKNLQITYVYQVKDGSYLFGLEPHHVAKVSGDEEQIYDVGFGKQKGTMVNCIYEDTFGTIWCALNNGLTVINNQALSYLDQSNGLTDEKISKVIEDAEHNIWLSTDHGGIQKVTHAKFQTVNMTTSVNSIAEDNFRGVIWLGCDKGLFCYKDDSFIENKITNFCKNIRIRNVEITADGEILISAYEKIGQVVVSKNDDIKFYTKAEGLAGNKTRVAIKATNGDIYVGTTTGLSIIDHETGAIENITKQNKIKNDYIMCIYEDSDGDIWCGTDGGGVFVLNKKHLIKVLATNNGLAGNVIFKILKGKNKELWICTGSGVTRYENGELFNYNSSNGLGTDSVFQTLIDNDEKMWFVSNKGISAATLWAMDEVRYGRKSSVDARFYGSSDGINSAGATSTALSMKDSIGRLWFTLIDGFVIYDSLKNTSGRIPPLVHLEEISVDSVKFNTRFDDIIIPPNAKRLRINFTGISFTAPDQLIFKTKLEGFEKDFTEWTSERTVSYTNLQPGTYKFFVIAQNGEGVVSVPSRILTIIKKPALWQHIWFWVLIVIIGIGIIFISVYKRWEFLKASQEHLERLINVRTKELTDLQHNLEKQVEQRTLELNKGRKEYRRLSIEVTRALAGTIDAKDKYTNGHSLRVAEYSKMIAESVGKTESEQEQIYYAGLLHDIGKIGVPDTIINKPGKLTEEEFEMMKKHPEIGGDILKSITAMPEVYKGARWHHERYDGKGYPDKLKGEEIPELARIIGVADAYDAMTSNRSYRKYLPQAVVREEIQKGKGTQFDPQFAEKMLEIIDADADYVLHE